MNRLRLTCLDEDGHIWSESLDSTDNSTDHDRDGLTALQEYCWPYTLDNCFEERSTLTGKPPEETESGLREYLDPRVSDTDGDGLPDGYEVHVYTRGYTKRTRTIHLIRIISGNAGISTL